MFSYYESYRITLWPCDRHNISCQGVVRTQGLVLGHMSRWIIESRDCTSRTFRRRMTHPFLWNTLIFLLGHSLPCSFLGLLLCYILLVPHLASSTNLPPPKEGRQLLLPSQESILYEWPRLPCAPALMYVRLVDRHGNEASRPRRQDYIR